ncbi:phage protein [Streptococcus pneumoniae]|nr:phage protein [Streptococcus pneumoniae]
MVKDVTNSLTEIKVDFQPAVINVDYDSVEKQLAAIVAQYTNYEVTASTYKIDYDERTRLNKLKEALETRRKEIKNNINNPYKEFEKWYKKTVEPLDNVIANITAGLNAIDEHERLLRVDVVRTTFEDRCMFAGIEKSTFADKYDEYSLKKYFKTGKYELKKTTLDEMDGLVLSEFDALEEYKANKQAIQEQAQEYDLPADSYIRHLEDGKSLVDILKMMKTDRDAEIARKEQKEIQEKAKAERLEEIAQSAKKNANANIKAYDAETGEILEQGTITPEPQNNAREVAKFEPSEPLVKLVRLELHGGLEQWENTQEYFEDNFIGFETLED